MTICGEPQIQKRKTSPSGPRSSSTRKATYITTHLPYWKTMATQQINPKRQQELQAQYQNYKTTLQQLAQKIGDIEQETEEHKLVIDTLEPLPGDRKCFRMINGVLVERTVKDVIPPLKTNSDGLKQVLDELLKQYKAKQDELDGWKVSGVFFLFFLLSY
ncbi:prefoldin subunit 2 [Blastomyces parvus]|uniref:Prefoldin subunit 2 n=1 Tax=Blastomyces parvus TaxID=2060905 RepID=A0A2B7XKX6_9EURO|nr:prefoldin subunit 2 [Blastomyces parvus]